MPAAFRRTPLALAILCLLENGPLHPYGLQRLIRLWGKDQVVNVGQRTSLYRAISRLEAAGLVTAGDTERDERYPERTTYTLTPAGRDTSRRWLAEMLATVRNEYPELPAALSFVMMLSPAGTAELLERRRAQVAAAVAGHEGDLGAEIDGYEIPRVVLLETEYQLALARAELAWLGAVLDDLRDGTLSWDPETLRPPRVDQ